MKSRLTIRRYRKGVRLRQGARLRRLPVALFATLLAAILLGPVAAQAAAQDPWVHPPQDLSASAQDAQYAGIAIGPDGTATAVWERRNGIHPVVQTATKPPGGSFGPVFDLAASGQPSQRSQIAIGADGTATVVWARYNGANHIAQAATRPPGGTFGLPVNISASGHDAIYPQIAIGPDGTTTAVWEEVIIGTGRIIQAATRPPGGSFGPAVNLSAGGGGAFDPRVAFGPDGTTTVVWSRDNGKNAIIQAATRLAGGSFGPPVNLSAVDQSAFLPQIAFGPDGTATAIWRRSNGTNTIIQAATRPPGGSFGPAEDLSASGQDANAPQIAIGPDGTATAVWQRDNGTNFIVQARTRPPGGSFGPAVNLSAGGQDTLFPQIAIGADGTANAVWQRSNGTNFIVQAATRPPGASFGPAEDLSESGQDAVSPRIAMGPDGAATVVWQRSDGSNTIIQTISTGSLTTLPGKCKFATLKLGKPTKNRKKGTAKLPATVNRPGKLTVKRSKTVKKSTKQARFGGTFKLIVKARGWAARKLRRNGSVKVTARVVFKQKGCPGKTKKKKVRLVRARR